MSCYFINFFCNGFYFCFLFLSPEIDNYHCGSSCVAEHFSVDYWTVRWAEVGVA